MKKRIKKHFSVLLAVVLVATTLIAMNFSKAEGASSEIVISESAGYEEGAYAEWASVQGADGYRAYVSADGVQYVSIDDTLIREYNDYWRVDTVGLKAGSYTIKVEAVKVNAGDSVTVLSTAVTGGLTVTSYDRSGFAFSSESPLKSGSGAYNDDGTLKAGAQVVYVTPETAKTCTATVNGVKVTGFQAILDAKQKKNTSGDIIDFRIVGCVKDTDLDKMSSSSEGLQIKGNATYTNMNITIEGIGEDAAIWGFGMLIRNCGNVEVRNLGILAFMDDGISLDTGNCNIWVHDLDLFYGKAGGDSDQAKGDGSVDIKGKSTYITVSYVHFWDSGKCSLCGMSDTEEFMVTYHHNWFDHSDSRHPRIRVASVHLYNNYFDGNSKYGVGTTKGSSAFVEANYFRNCKYPMMSSLQGTDAMGEGTFSGEAGGMIKAYNNKIEGAQSLIYANAANGATAANAVSFDAYLASARSEKVPTSYKTLSGGTTYNNFDTSSDYDLGVKESSIDAPENVPSVVTAKAGRLGGGDFKWTFSDSEDNSYALNTELKAAVMAYQSPVKSIGGMNGAGSGSEETTPAETQAPTDESTPTTTAGSTETTGSETETTTASGESGNSHIHNFTNDGKDNAYYTINGNLSTSKGTVDYNGMTLTQCLKMESSTKITFTNTSDAKLTLVFNSANSSNVKVDGVKYTLTDGILEMDITAGTHEITKADTANLYYIAVQEAGGDGPADEPTEEVTNPTEPTAEQTPAETQVTTSSSESGEGPQTSDNSIMVLWVWIVFMSGAGVWYFGKKKNTQTQG